MVLKVSKFIVIFICIICINSGGVMPGENTIKLSQPDLKGTMTVEQALYNRKSIRSYKKGFLSLSEVSQVLWASQGKAKWDNRTAPSAGATYPIELYLVAGDVEGLEQGVYRYIHKNHSLELIKKGDMRKNLMNACMGQDMILNAQMTIIMDAVPKRTGRRYGHRATRYIAIEAGHIGQNIYLQSTALGLGTVSVGAFGDNEVKALIPELESPLYIFPVGKQ